MKKLSIKDKAMAATLNAVGTSTPLPSPSAANSKPKTGPGATMAFMNRESAAMRENQELREELRQWSESQPVASLDPQLVKLSRYANRAEAHFLGKDFDLFKKEIESAGGNVQPIKVRPISGTSPQEYEVIFGHRRHRACLELGINVSALIHSVDDKTLFEEMDRENRARKNLSAWEQGEMYRRALAQGLYPSQRRLAEALGLDISNVSTAIKIAELPDSILDAFASRLDIQNRWAKQLADALIKAPDVVLARAKAIAEARAGGEAISSADTLERLLHTKKTPSRSLKVHGKQIGTVKTNNKGGYVFEFNKDALSAEQAKRIETLIADVLK